ncbi:TonB-dependent receptor domain-containing protein [Gynuella sunshinyii]|uniref:Outer membrane cobalamin receptor protein n=1 Tax=Gynuella sunshinyii YC6258 TaxID=1445510 RepID=A0A0C5VVI5_9GAMM|nr:TonB-dependent receptor [Gynuella sunshinyii]AJQ94484.1 outer membrane cobalamin receptor protein [Gynuella sunshinyii YC6258]
MIKPFRLIPLMLLATYTLATSDIVVTATRTQTSKTDSLSATTVITAKDIQESGAADLTELLKHTPGVIVSSSGSQGSSTSIFLRGMPANKITVLIDGVPAGSATLGTMALNHIPLATIERIEIVRGPVSSLYGANAMAGVIQVFTNKSFNNDKTYSGTIGTTVGNYDTIELRIGSQYHSERINISGNISATHTAGYNSTTQKTGTNSDRDGYNELLASLASSATINSKTKINLAFFQTQNTVEFDSRDFYTGTDIAGGSYTENTIQSGSGEIIFKLNDAVEFNSKIGFYSEESDTTSTTDSLIVTDRLYGHFKSDVEIDDHNILTTGVDLTNEDVSRSSTNYQIEKRGNIGFFSQIQSNQGQFEAIASMRYDDNEAYGDFTTGSIAIGFGDIEQAKLILSYGTAFRAPTVNELYWPNSDPYYHGNPDLKPEKSRNYELTLKGQTELIDWSYTIFRTEITDMIETAYNSDTGISLPENIDKAEISGMETVLGAYLYGFDVNLTSTALQAIDTKTDKHVNGTADITENLSISRSFADVTVKSDFLYDSGRYVDNDNSTLDSYLIVGLELNYHPKESINIGFRVNNVTDKEYFTNRSGTSFMYRNPGRNYKLSLDYSF